MSGVDVARMIQATLVYVHLFLFLNFGFAEFCLLILVACMIAIKILILMLITSFKKLYYHYQTIYSVCCSPESLYVCIILCRMVRNNKLVYNNHPSPAILFGCIAGCSAQRCSSCIREPSLCGSIDLY